ncbi:hypothetical protein RvY_03576-2 [Ramazzottius varieornatus]|uniref:Uncharacterized protein n=1 Tax=Ramazzottius varieornatus TaxID=947166 RepID=A0A1D1UXX6_RAMVA|nr:hypothetical protein RvY_03576-2 [Ramazzottius varieornatus]
MHSSRRDRKCEVALTSRGEGRSARLRHLCCTWPRAVSHWVPLMAHRIVTWRILATADDDAIPIDYRQASLRYSIFCLDDITDSTGAYFVS